MHPAFPLAAGAWIAVLAGLIPILGIAAAGYLIYRVARDEGDEDDATR